MLHSPSSNVEDQGPVHALAVELVRLRRATETLRTALGSRSGLETGATWVLVTAAKAGPQRPSDLAKSLGLDPSTLSRHVATLERRGLVQRTPLPGDGRAHLVEATDEGRAVVAEVVAHRHRMLHQVLGEWPEQDVLSLATLLARLNDSVDAAGFDSLLAQSQDQPEGRP